jgi:hypothetical protein
VRNKALAAYYFNYERWPAPDRTRLDVKMARSIPILFIVTAGFAVTELSACRLRQSPVLADRPVAYYRLGEAPGYIIAVDSAANAPAGVPEGTSRLRVLTWDVPFTIEAWVQLINDYQVEAGTGSGDRLDIPPWEGWLSGSTILAVSTPLNEDFSEARGAPGEAIIPNYALAPAGVEGPYAVEAVVETSALTSLLGLVLILFGLGWRGPLKFRGSNAGLSHARVFQGAGLKLRKRSESELNSFSARYATIEVQAVASLSHPPRSHQHAEPQF